MKDVQRTTSMVSFITETCMCTYSAVGCMKTRGKEKVPVKGWEWSLVLQTDAQLFVPSNENKKGSKYATKAIECENRQLTKAYRQ